MPDHAEWLNPKSYTPHHIYITRPFKILLSFLYSSTMKIKHSPALTELAHLIEKVVAIGIRWAVVARTQLEGDIFVDP